jgi:hypothetical protein
MMDFDIYNNEAAVFVHIKTIYINPGKVSLNKLSSQVLQLLVY